MLGCVFRFRLRQPLTGVVCLGLVALVLATAMRTVATAASDSPIRGYWVSRAALDSPEAIRRALTAVQSAAFETVFIPISASNGEAPAGYDGAREFIREARERHLRVYAWIDVNRVAADDEIPSSRAHVAYEHPEWLMVPRALASEMLKMDPRGPAYLGRLSRWTRSNRATVDGLYLSPLDPEAASYLAKAVAVCVQRYGVDGVYLDAVRFPSSDFDYSRHALDLFRAMARARLSPSERARMDAIEAIDPFGYPSELPEEWAAFRQMRLTALVSRLRASLKVINPLLTVTANVALDEATAREEQFQDWRSWISERLIDGVGRRSGSSTEILLAPDGLIPEPSPVPAGGQSSGIGGSR